MMVALLRGLIRGLLWLRYHVRVDGLEEVARRGTRGILFLPNHPALIDPPIVVSRLHGRFRVRALADRDQVGRPFIRWIARQANVITIPDPLLYGGEAKGEVLEGILACAEALRQGENVLLYPAGHLARSQREDLGAASAVETLLKEAPDCRVVLVRTRGLWGSGFSRAAGQAPEMGKMAGRALRSVLSSFIFFVPRRQVSLQLVEPGDFPRNRDRGGINRYLEDFYNRDLLPARYVPYTLWERGGVRDLPEPRASNAGGSVGEVPLATRELVLEHLKRLTGRSSIAMEDHLARDLGMDSLSLVDLALWVEAEFGFQIGDGAGMETVGDVLLAARGSLLSAPVALKPVDAAWFRTGTGERVTIPAGRTLGEVILSRIREAPGRVLLADQVAGVLTGRDVLTGVLAFRSRIERLPGDHVGILMPASGAAVILYLATLYAGKVPVMVNWTVGLRNMMHSLDLLDVQSVLTSGKVIRKMEAGMGDLGPLKERLLCIEALRGQLGRGEKWLAWFRARVGGIRKLGQVRMPETAVVLFTSGSESLPKAVPLTHGNLLANLRDLGERFCFRDDDRLVGILPPFHSFGLTCTVLLPLCAGVPVVYHPNPTEGGVLSRLIEAYKVSLLVGTPTFLAGILRAVTGRELDTLRAVISGAEKCPDATYDLVQRMWPHLKLLEGYGITECSPVVSVNEESEPRRGTIGRVLPSVDYAVADLELRGRVEPGATGMLLVRGPSIFGGYLQYDGPSPFVEFEGRKWYRTGDLVTEAGGCLVFAGRLKRFVKLGGEMISLPAIEEVLMRHYGKASDEEPVLAVEATPAELNPELVLFAVREMDREEVNNRIRAAGLSALHNIRMVRRIEQIPLLGSGKTDYRALKALLAAGAGSSA